MVFGMGGTGKTTLAAHVSELVKAEFDSLFWRSVFNAQPLANILRSCLLHISGGREIEFPDEQDKRLTLLLRHLRKRRCLIVIDNMETLFAAGAGTGNYLPGYADYGALLQMIGSAGHRSVLLLTSREMPREVAAMASAHGPVRVLSLAGLDESAGTALLADRGLRGPTTGWPELVSLYDGNPLQIKLASHVVSKVFQGSVPAFLNEQIGTIRDTRLLIESQFKRLSPEEESVMCWLAIRREPATISELAADTIPPVSKTDIVAALESLADRSFVTAVDAGRFGSQPVIAEYTTDYLLMQFLEEIKEGRFERLSSHAVAQATAKGYLHDAQVRVLIEPLAARLSDTIGYAETTRRIRLLLDRLRVDPGGSTGYAPATLLQLVLHLRLTPADFDFSSLTIREALLQGVPLRDVNFTDARFERTRFTDTFGVINDVAAAHSSELIAACTDSGDVRLWRTEDGSPVRTWREHSGQAWSVAFSNDDQYVVSGGADRTIRVWEIRTGKCVRVCRGHTEAVAQVACHPAEPLMASAGHDNTARLWNLATGQVIASFTDHGNWVSGVAFTADGAHFASCSLDGTVRVGHIASLARVAELRTEDDDSLWSVAFSIDGTLVAAGGFDGIIRIWDWRAGRLVKAVPGHSMRVASLEFLPSGAVLASAGADSTIRLWSTSTWECCGTLAGHELGGMSVAAFARQARLVSGGDDQTVRLWNTDSREAQWVIHGHEQPLRAVAGSPDATLIASAGDETEIRVWDMSRRRTVRTLTGHHHWIQAVTFSPDGTMLASTGDDQSVRLYEVATGRQLQVMTGHTGWVADVAFSPDGTRLASAGTHAKIRIWDVATGQQLQSIDAYDSSASAVAYTSDGRLLVSAGHDHHAQVRLFDAASGAPVATLDRHVGAVTALAVTRDSRWMVTAGTDGLVIVWDLREPGHARELTGPASRLRSVSVSPDGELIAAGGEDRSIHLWRLRDGQLQRVLRGHAQTVTALAFMPTGQSLLSASADGTIRVWDTSSGGVVCTLIPDRPYERMRITKARGLSAAQRETLRQLGAADEVLRRSQASLAGTAALPPRLSSGLRA
jgi:WD40 repeat protein